MLQVLLVFTAALALMSIVLAEAGLVAARTAYQRVARSYAAVALTGATGNFVSYAQEEVRKEGPDALSMPEPPDAPPNGTYDACSSEQVGSEPASAPACHFAVIVTNAVISSTLAGPGTSVAHGVQSQHVRERRVSVAIEADVVPYDPATRTISAPVASKARFVTLRTFANAPFAALAGVRNVDSNAGMVDAGQGDSAGTNVSDRGYRDPSDTGIHVQLDCKQGFHARGQTGTAVISSGPSLEGLPNAKGWAVEPPCDFAKEGVDHFDTQNWNAGTENTSGWSR